MSILFYKFDTIDVGGHVSRLHLYVTNSLVSNLALAKKLSKLSIVIIFMSWTATGNAKLILP